MSDQTTIILSLVALFSTIVTGLFGLLMARIKEYHVAVNSKLDKAMAVLEAAALARGVLAGIAEEKARSVEGFTYTQKTAKKFEGKEIGYVNQSRGKTWA